MGSIIDHTIRKVACNRKADEIEKYRLSYHIDIPEKKIVNKVLKLDYVFSLKYLEDVGEITVEGSLSYKDTPKALKKADENWSESVALQHRIYNVIFRNSIIMVMDMARHVGLPPPILLPELQPEQLSQGA